MKIKQGREKPELDAESVAKFEAWWVLYPRKEAKLRSMKAWQQLSHAERDLAINGVRGFALVWSGRPSNEVGRFCPLPYTWLVERRFLDTITSAPNAEDPAIEAGRKWQEKAADGKV